MPALIVTVAKIKFILLSKYLNSWHSVCSDSLGPRAKVNSVIV